MFKGYAPVRITLYIISIVVNGAAIGIRAISPEWGDALQYIGGALAAFTGVVALSNVERESTKTRVQRIVRDEIADTTGEIPVQDVTP